jgi:hypothetical protein
MVSNTPDKEGIPRRTVLKGGAALAAMAALGVTPESVHARTYEEISQFDWNTVDFVSPHVRFHTPYMRQGGRSGFGLNLQNPNIKLKEGRINEFYGIKVEDIPESSSHAHSGFDPFEGHKNRVDDSCCNRYDCGKAIVKEVGVINTGEMKGQLVYAYALKIDDVLYYAISVPTVTEVYDKDHRMGEYPNYGCVYIGIPMCLFLDRTT